MYHFCDLCVFIRVLDIVCIYQGTRYRVYLSGTRYRRRGVDTQGNVANFVETEMVLLYLSLYWCCCCVCNHVIIVCYIDLAGRITSCLICHSERIRSCVLDPTWDQVSSSTCHRERYIQCTHVTVHSTLTL